MLSVEEVRARGITLPLGEDDAYAVIDEAEAWLAARIGPLDGERTETFLVARPWEAIGWAQRQAILRLRRPAGVVEVTDNAVVVADAELRGESFLFSATSYWNGPVAVTYTPTDFLLVRGVVIDLLRLGATETGYESETIGSYSYTRSKPGASLSRWSVLRRLFPRQVFDAVPVRSSFDRPFPSMVVSSDLVTVTT